MPDILQITDRQYAAFRKKSLDDANARMVAYLRERFPEDFGTSPASSVVTLIERMRSKAAEFGIENEDDVASYLDLAVLHGEGFHEEEWAEATLNSVYLSGPEKMRSLCDAVRESGVDL